MENINLELNGNIIIYDNEESYKSTVQEVQDNSIVINVPLGKGTYYPLEIGEEVEINYFGGGNYYIFKTKLVGKEKMEGNGIPVYRLEWPYQIKKIQRREYVRVDYIDYIYYCEATEKDKPWKKGILLNLSGGGIRFSTDELLLLYDMLRFKIMLDNNVYEIDGKIVREIENFDNSFKYAVEFINIKESIREKIIQKVFKQMKKHRESI